MAKRKFKTESRRILDMMINSVYTNREIFLRELISNASDAMDKLSYRALTDDTVTFDKNDMKITVSADKDGRKIVISDRGVGMTEKELEENLGVIAKSGSYDFKAEQKEKSGESDIIGQFGVGFYSAFMVSEKVCVLSKAYGAESANLWSSDGTDGYRIEPAEKENFGTEITLYIRSDDKDGESFSEFLDEEYLSRLVKKYSDYIRYPIEIGGKTVNSMVPIWQRPKDEVSDDDLKAFYREAFHDISDPAGIIRINAEGTVSFKALLFIPKSIPFDYYTAAYKPGLRLYSGGVMIMEKCDEILPEHFRFVCGIVDSPDLSLNISREILQQTRQLAVIRTNIEKRIKSELLRLLENDRDNYNEFYKAFGLQLKYGVLNDYGAKAQLLQDLIMFISDKEKTYVTLKEYCDKAPEEQKYIYFAAGKTVQAAQSLPQTELVRERGYDILCMTDGVDEFVAGIIGKFGEREFKSVNDDNLGVEDGEKTEKTDKLIEENAELLDFVKEALDGKVAEVRLSKKLKSYPVCLSALGDITLEMEKYFASLPGQSGEAIKAQRVLELNPENKAFDTLCRIYGEDKERAKKFAQLLYGQAEMIAGYLPENPAELSLLMTEFLG